MKQGFADRVGSRCFPRMILRHGDSGERVTLPYRIAGKLQRIRRQRASRSQECAPGEKDASKPFDERTAERMQNRRVKSERALVRGDGLLNTTSEIPTP